MLIPEEQERCYCVGTPGVKADQGSPFTGMCKDFLPGLGPTDCTLPKQASPSSTMLTEWGLGLDFATFANACAPWGGSLARAARQVDSTCPLLTNSEWLLGCRTGPRCWVSARRAARPGNGACTTRWGSVACSSPSRGSSSAP